MVFQLTDDPTLFPNPYHGEDDGLIAVGGDLSQERLTNAYAKGFFPWYGFKEREEILWWCPLKRFVIFPKEIHVSHSMRQTLRRGTFTVTFNQAFHDVITHCSKTDNRDEQEGAWLGGEMIKAYERMFRHGLCMSVEVWSSDGSLAGGLYGVSLGRNFFGESMFSLKPDASKLALIKLAERIGERGGIIDCQFETAHLKSMGGRHISYKQYLEIITER